MVYIKPIDIATGRSSTCKKNNAAGEVTFQSVLKTAQSQSSSLPRENRYDQIFQAAGEKWNIPPTVLKAIAKAESNFNPDAVSPAGAQGMMQLMPATARSLGVDDPLDPTENIFAGARYFRSMLDRFGDDPKLALAAYNAGPGNVKKYAGIPPFQETQRYVEKIMSSLGEVTLAEGGTAQTTASSAANSIDYSSQYTDTFSQNSFADFIRFWAEIRLSQISLVGDDNSDYARIF